MNPEITTLTKSLIYVCFGIIISACSHNQQLPIKLVYSANDCPINTATLRSINDADQLKEIMTSEPKSFIAPLASLPTIDYDTHSLVLFALGQKPTSGYSIELFEQQASIKNNRLYLPARMKQPEKGSFQAQVITRPCQIFSIPKADFDEIILLDDKKIE